MSKEVGGMVGSRRVKGARSARTEGARRATGVSADGAAVGWGALAPGQRWSASRKRDVVLRLVAEAQPTSGAVPVSGSMLLGRDQPGVEEQVGVYLNESVISVSLFTPDIDLFDMSRIDVLRGPQGTLFGSGSLAGTVRYITNQPVIGVMEGSGEFGVSSLHSCRRPRPRENPMDAT